jgi:hypothetical protein
MVFLPNNFHSTSIPELVVREKARTGVYFYFSKVKRAFTCYDQVALNVVTNVVVRRKIEK